MKRYVPILAVLLVVVFTSDGWAPPPSGGGGSGIPIRKVQDLLDVTKPLSPSNGQSFVYSDTAGKWVATTPAGGGDMLKSTYDADSNNAIDDTAIPSGIMRDAEWTSATLTAPGKVELATTTESIAGTDATRAVTPDGLTDVLSNAGVVDWTSDQGATNIHTGNYPITDTEVPNTITIDLATAASALAANPDNCQAGSYARGIAADGTAEDCTADSDTTYSASDGVDLTGTNFTFDGTLDEVGNPGANKSFNMTSYQLRFLYVQPTTGDGAFEIEASGAFDGDLLHVHQHTGNPSASDLVHLEAEDADVLPLRITSANATAISTDGDIKADDLIVTGLVDGVDIATRDHAVVTALAFAAITGSITDAQVPDDITIDGTANVSDASLPDAGTFASVVGTDVTAVTTLDIPSGATCDSSEAGEVCVDTTDDQFIYYGAAARVIPYKMENSFAIASTTLLENPDTHRLIKSQDGITITDIHCITDTGTVIIELMEQSATGTGDATVDAPITCDSNGAEDDGSLSNGPIDAADWIAARIGTAASSPTILNVTWYYTVTRE